MLPTSRTLPLPVAPARLHPFILALCFLAQIGCGPTTPEAVDDAAARLPAVVDYNYHVQPILSDRCYKCHGPDDNAREADLRLDTPDGLYARTHESTRNRVIAPGSLRRSEVAHRILSGDPDERMPPPASNLSLTSREQAMILRWIEQGAEYKPHWSLIPPTTPAQPTVSDPSWPVNGIDAFVLARLDREGLTPAPEAAKETLLRRVTFDLTGLPPALDELDAFLADDSPRAYERAVDRLLDAPAYGERMAAIWLDVARYADSHGYQDDGLRNMWPWRDWVIRAFNDNVPYDDFVTWQLAGDLLPEPTHDQRLATGFNRNHLQSQEGGIVPEEYRIEYVADRTQTFGTAFLGLTLQCARCHDHKFDTLTQKEYFQLFAFFNNVNEFGNIPYSGEASPTMVLVDEADRAKLTLMRAQIHNLEAEVSPTNANYDDGYAAWRARQAERPSTIAPPRPIAYYPLDGVTDRKLTNRTDARKPASLQGDPDKTTLTVPGRFGQAQTLVGDTFIDMGKDLAYFERNEPFSISLWFNIIQEDVEGPLFNKAGGLFNGKRGYVGMINADRTFSASLNHVFPANSIEVETLAPLPIQAWHHLVMTYDGSSRAEGIRLFLDGVPLPTKVKVDNLELSILYAVDPRTGESSNWGDSGNLRLGWMENNFVKLDSVSVDEMKVFDDRLTALEVEALYGHDDVLASRLTRSPADEAALRDHYVTRHAPAYRDAFDRLTRLRGEENERMTRQQQVMVMDDLPEPRVTYILDRGAYDAPREPVTAATPAALTAFPDSLPPNRLGLARWLLSPDHPLTARVIVNRYWQQFFGRGLVGTPDDFGNQGALPTHPLLLDWLATTFIADGWDVKAMQKRIVMSATYRQSSVADAALRERDPGNELLARGPSYRLAAEMIRDNALSVSGLLVPTIGGPSVKPYQPAGLWKELATRNATEYVQDHGDKLYRRSLYTIWKRTTPPPSMMSFDATERNVCTVTRQATSTPLQALILLNDPQYVEAARMLAERMLREGGGTLDERLTFAFRLLTSRYPTDAERTTLAALYQSEQAHYAADRTAALALLATGEHPRDEAYAPDEVAALAVVANTIMNFDEAVIKR